MFHHENNGERASSSLRVLKMHDEARAFDRELQTFQAMTLKFEHATERFFGTLDPILRAPLPRVWTSVEGGLAEPIRAPVSHEHGHTVGGDAAFGALAEARRELHGRVLVDVLKPMDEWREMLRVVEERVPELMKQQAQADRRWAKLQAATANYERKMGRERAASERAVTMVDNSSLGARSARRHTGVARRNPLTACFSHTPSYPGHDDYSEGDEDESDYGLEFAGQSVSREIRHENISLRLSKQRRKFDAARAAFLQTEDLVGGQLRGLVVDASWLKSYAVGTLVVAKEAMQIGVVGMHKTKQPLPSFVDRYPRGIPKGALHSNLHLVGGLPPSIDLGRMRPTQAPTAALLLPDQVSAHRATAQPMETHARPDVSGLERVVAPPTAATDIALSSAEKVLGPRAARDVAARAAGVAEEEEAEDLRFRGRPAGGVTAPAYSPMGGASAGATPRYRAEGGMGGGYEEGRAAQRGGGAFGREEPLEGRRAAREVERAAEREALEPRGGGGGLGMGAGAGGGAGTGGMGAALGPEEGAAAPRGRASAPAGEEVCGREHFTQVEDRPIVKERVERVLEHRPVEKQYVTETKFVGEHGIATATPETPMGPVTERVVEAAAPGPVCPNPDAPVHKHGAAEAEGLRGELLAA